MPAKEIKELRKEGRLNEAYDLAKAELEADSMNIWCKRNMAWVLYSQLGEAASDLETFVAKINEVKALGLPASEEMFFENISIAIARAARTVTHEEVIDTSKMNYLFDAIKELPIKKDSKWYSVLYRAMHKGMKESGRYIEFADWWDFNYFRPEDFQQERMQDGRSIMAIAEQAYITYAKHLLQKNTNQDSAEQIKEKIDSFLPRLSKIVDNYPHFQYPAYFKAKLLLSLGDKESMLEPLLPFARKKRNDFWVWEIIAEAFSADPQKVFACFCKALSCNNPSKMLIGLRQKMTKILITKELYNEARTEIDLLAEARLKHGFAIPHEVANWKNSDWYKKASPNKSNDNFYKTFSSLAEGLLFSDVKEETVIVEFVNNYKKMLNFIGADNKIGFFKYNRFFESVQIGDILSVRFQGGEKDGMHQVYTAVKTQDELFKKAFLKEIQGTVKIPSGKEFGFIDDVFIPPALVKKYQLTHGKPFTGKAIKSYHREKKQIGWKLL